MGNIGHEVSKRKEEREKKRERREERPPKSILEALGSPWGGQMRLPGAASDISGAARDVSPPPGLPKIIKYLQMEPSKMLWRAAETANLVRVFCAKLCVECFVDCSSVELQ